MSDYHITFIFCRPQIWHLLTPVSITRTSHPIYGHRDCWQSNINSSRAEPKILLGSLCDHPQNRNRGLTSKIAKRLKNQNSSSLSFNLCYHHKINLNPNPPQFYNKDPFVHTLLRFFFPLFFRPKFIQNCRACKFSTRGTECHLHLLQWRLQGLMFHGMNIFIPVTPTILILKTVLEQYAMIFLKFSIRPLLYLLI